MAWTKEARAAAAAKRRARGPRSGAKGYRDQITDGKRLLNDKTASAAQIRYAYQKVTNNPKAGYGTSKQSLKIGLHTAIMDRQRGSSAMTSMEGRKFKLKLMKKEGTQGAADRIWAAMKRGK